jgi:hypothetical protein
LKLLLEKFAPKGENISLENLIEETSLENNMPNLQLALCDQFADMLPKIGYVEDQYRDQLLLTNVAHKTNQSFIIRQRFVIENQEEVLMEDFIGNSDNQYPIIINVDEQGYSYEMEKVDLEHLTKSVVLEEMHADLNPYKDSFLSYKFFTFRYIGSFIRPLEAKK